MADGPAAGAEGDRSLWIRAALLKYEEPLVLYASRLLGDVERARDVVQDTFLRLCDRGPEAADEQRLAGWLYTTCRNRSLDVRRKEGRMKPLSEVEVGTRELDAADPSQGDPSRCLEQAEAVDSVMQSLGQLPERQREAIRLKFQHELSYRQIAEVMEQSVSNVGFLIHAGLKALRSKTVRAGHGGY